MSNIDSRNIIEALASGDIESFKSLVTKRMFQYAIPKIDNISKSASKSLMHEEEDGEEAVGSSVSADDPTLDPNMEREYFLKSFDVGDVLVTIKTIGVGRNKPVSVYLDDQRWEMFPGPIKAEEEATEFVNNSDRYEKWKEKKGLNNQPEPEEEEEEDAPPIEGEEDDEESDSEEEKPSSDETSPPTKEKKDKKEEKPKNESVLNNLKKILKYGKPQKITFENNESIEVNPFNAGHVVAMHEMLNTRNKVEFERILNKDKSEFAKATEFSFRKLLSKD